MMIRCERCVAGFTQERDAEDEGGRRDRVCDAGEVRETRRNREWAIVPAQF